MTSRQLVDFVERKLVEHGVKKLLPETDILEEHARRLLEQRFAEEAIAPLRTEIAERARNAELPADLEQSVADELEQKPHFGATHRLSLSATNVSFVTVQPGVAAPVLSVLDDWRRPAMQTNTERWHRADC
jgi:hypothetical protein